MIIGIDNVINWIETNKTPYWYVKDLGGTKLIFASQTDEEQLALEDSKTKLRQCLQTLANGSYSIEAWQSEGQKKSRVYVKFQITSSDNSISIGISGVNNATPQIPQKTIEQLIEEALYKERTVNKIERLEADLKAKEARIKELETELDSFSTRIGKRVDQIFGPILDMNEATKEKTSIGDLDEESEEIASLMERWSNADSDFKTPLKGLVLLAETKSPKYTMGKQFLSNGN